MIYYSLDDAIQKKEKVRQQIQQSYWIKVRQHIISEVTFLMPKRIADTSNAFWEPFLLCLCLNWPLNFKGKQQFVPHELREDQNIFVFETMHMTNSASNHQAAYIFCSSGCVSIFWVHIHKWYMHVSLPSMFVEPDHLVSCSHLRCQQRSFFVSLCYQCRIIEQHLRNSYFVAMVSFIQSENIF